jgi:integrase
MKSRCIVLFENYLHSKYTIKTYSVHIELFRKYHNLPTWDSILSLKTKDFKEKMEDYVIMLKNQNKSNSYIRNITFGLQSLFEANDREDINWKKIRRLAGGLAKPKDTRPYTTEEIKRMLSVTKSLRNRALILFFSSSGVRRGAIPNLKLKDLKQMTHGCLSVTVYSGEPEQYITFINKEASEALGHYHNQRKRDGEILTSESLVFASTWKENKGKPLNETTISLLIRRIKHLAGLDTESLPNLLVHAFRRRFNTILKLKENANSTIIERLMGHDQGLDNSYFQPTEEQLFEEYAKGMSDLTIDDSERLLAERKLMEESLSELEAEKNRTSILEKEVAQQKAQLAEMAKILASGKGKVVEQRGNEYFIELTE